jgi:hypothetical protein
MVLPFCIFQQNSAEIRIPKERPLAPFLSGLQSPQTKASI